MSKSNTLLWKVQYQIQDVEDCEIELKDSIESFNSGIDELIENAGYEDHYYLNRAKDLFKEKFGG